MPYFLRIHGGIGMHAGYLPGYPASHGCIRLPEKMAVHFLKMLLSALPWRFVTHWRRITSRVQLVKDTRTFLR